MSDPLHHSLQESQAFKIIRKAINYNVLGGFRETRMRASVVALQSVLEGRVSNGMLRMETLRIQHGQSESTFGEKQLIFLGSQKPKNGN